MILIRQHFIARNRMAGSTVCAVVYTHSGQNGKKNVSCNIQIFRLD